MIDEHEWQSVLQVVADGTFSQAAKHLFVSQPSLSQCIKKIENELGMQIFDRGKTPLQLTEAGRIYVEAARQMQIIRKNLFRQINDIAELRSGSLTIGSSHTRSICLLTDALANFHQRYPAVQLTVVEGSTARLQEHVLRGNVDFALLYDPLDSKLFNKIPIMQENIIMAVPFNHHLTKAFNNKQPIPYPKISFKFFQNEPYIALKSDRCMSVIYDELCKSTEVLPKVVFKADSILSAAELCAKGMGATMVTDMVIKRNLWSKTPFFFELEEEIKPRQLVAAYGVNQILSKAAQVFLQFLH